MVVRPSRKFQKEGCIESIYIIVVADPYQMLKDCHMERRIVAGPKELADQQIEEHLDLPHITLERQHQLQVVNNWIAVPTAADSSTKEKLILYLFEEVWRQEKVCDIRSCNPSFCLLINYKKLLNFIKNNV